MNFVRSDFNRKNAYRRPVAALAIVLAAAAFSGCDGLAMQQDSVSCSAVEEALKDSAIGDSDYCPVDSPITGN